MKKYIVSFLVASIFLAGAPFAVQQASASDLSIRDFVNLLIIIGVIPADKIPAVNAYLAAIDNTTTPVTPINNQLPIIKSLSAHSGVSGNTITIYGKNLKNPNGDTLVQFLYQGVDAGGVYASSVKTDGTQAKFKLDGIVIANSAPVDQLRISYGPAFPNATKSNAVNFNIASYDQSAISITSVQSPAEDPNVLHPGERTTVYGTNLDADNIYAYIIGKAYDQTVSTYNPHYGSIDFTVPNIRDAGNYYLSLKQPGKESNRLNVKVVLPIVSTQQPIITGLGTNNALAGEKVAAYISNLPTNTSMYSIVFSGPQAGDVTATLSSDRTYLAFTVPSLTPGNYSISAMFQTSTGAQIAVSNSVSFTIGSSSVQPSITVTSPNGGEILPAGGIEAGGNIGRITWTSSNWRNLNINIDLVSSSGQVIKNIAQNIPNSGSYYWPADTSLMAGSYKIMVSSFDRGPSVEDYSDNYFTINSSMTTAGVCSSVNGATLGGQPTNLCSIGNPSAVTFTQSSLQWTWTCQDINGGAMTNCYALSASVNATCGSANGVATSIKPTTNLCSSGLATNVNLSANSSYWYWMCAGSGRGTSENCTANVVR